MVRPGMGSLGLAALLALGLARAGDLTDKPSCSAHGTTIDFFDTPAEAAKQAKKEAKLVFVLHVSGNFEDPRFT
jgi:predicted outer membrane protein